MSPETGRLLTAMYPGDAPGTLASYGAARLPDRHAWPHKLGFVAATPNAGADPTAVDAVVASTCVDHCEADPDLLAATVLADLVHGAVVARRLGVPLLSLVGIGQEIRLVPGGGALAGQWRAVAGRVAAVFAGLALPAGSRLASTDEESVWQCLTEVVDRDRPRVADRCLDGLYHLDDGSLFPRGTPFGFFYEYYRYNLACYRRHLVETLLDCGSVGVLVVENVQQVKAVATARRLAAGWPVEHLVTLPAPGRSGRERATRATGADRVTLADLLATPDRALAAASPDSGAFWRAVCHHHTMLRLEGVPG